MMRKKVALKGWRARRKSVAKGLRVPYFTLHYKVLRRAKQSSPRRRVWATSRIRRDLAFLMADALGHLPTAETARGWLADLRANGCPLPILAVLLGTGAQTFDCWQRGDRRPSGAALRCLWLVHRLWMGDAPRTLADWFYWLPPRKPGEEPPSCMDGDGI